MSKVEELPKVCVILGAGASTDVHNGSAPVLNGGIFKPPLARDLFAIGKHPEYFPILSPYPEAQSLASVLSPLSDVAEFDLESRLRELADHPDDRVRQQFKHVPPYLRDLLWRASYEYTHTPGTYLQLIYALLADVPHHVLFLVLNYDTLLEQALALFPKMDFSNVESYVREDRQVKVVKLHGSINWFKLIGRANQSWENLVGSQDVFQRTPDHEIYIENTAGPLMSVLITENRPYPILTAPLAGKGMADIVCPSMHIQAAKEFLQDCRKFLVIGSSGLDQDLLAPLNEAVQPSSHPALQLVGGSDAELALEKFERGVRAFRNRRITPPGFLFSSGFRQYVDSGDLRRFAEFNSRRSDRR